MPDLFPKEAAERAAAIMKAPWEFTGCAIPLLARRCYAGDFLIKGTAPSPEEEKQEASTEECEAIREYARQFQQMADTAELTDEQKSAYLALANKLSKYLDSTACARCGRVNTSENQRVIVGRSYCNQKLVLTGFPTHDWTDTRHSWEGGCADLAEIDASNHAWIASQTATPCPACGHRVSQDAIHWKKVTAADGYNPHAKLHELYIPTGPSGAYSGVEVGIAVSSVCGNPSCLITRNRPHREIKELEEKIRNMKQS